MSDVASQVQNSDELNRLVRLANQGNNNAQHQLGIRLLIGDRAPHRPQDGVGMLVAALKNGHAAAPATLSVLHALGLHVQQGWTIALDLLALSADRGDQSSREQLTILAGLSPDSICDSRTLVGQVNLDEWVSLPRSRLIHDQPLIKSYPTFTTPEICNWLINKSRNRLRPAQVYDAVSREVKVHKTRTNTSAIYNLAETDLLQLLVQARMSVCTGLPFRNFEASTVLHYEVEQAIHNHFDFIDPDAPDYQHQIQTQGQRVITFLVYLNDDYEGGETAFPELGLAHKGKAGEGLYFVNALPDGAPDLRTLHAGVAPSQGEKWIVSQFIRNRQVF